MSRALTVTTEALPLFVWTEIAALEDVRADLCRRIASLPRFSHRRVVLEARLCAATEKQLRLECAFRAKSS